jgi:hypothetical protein
MSLHRSPHSNRQASWVTILALGLAAIASVQLIAGSTPILWLIIASAALWGLLIQASRTQDSTAIRVRHGRYRERSAHR